MLNSLTTGRCAVVLVAVYMKVPVLPVLPLPALSPALSMLVTGRGVFMAGAIGGSIPELSMLTTGYDAVILGTL